MDYTYLLILPAMILAIYAQSKVGSTFQKYSEIKNQHGLTGADVARQLLQASGIQDVKVEPVAGKLTDHYDPRNKVLRLSESVYGSASLSAIGVAAHETGHAVQDATGYTFLRMRSSLAPIAGFGSNLSMPMIFLGILFGAFSGSGFGYTLIQWGIVFFTFAVVFHLITLPVELNASNRAIAMLEDNRCLTQEEIKPARKVLSAAALTYIAAAAVSVTQLIRLLLLFGGRDRE